MVKATNIAIIYLIASMTIYAAVAYFRPDMSEMEYSLSWVVFIPILLVALLLPVGKAMAFPVAAAMLTAACLVVRALFARRGGARHHQD